MCKQPRKLSPCEAAEYRKCLREMKTEGIDVGTVEPENDSRLDVTIVGGLESLIFNLPNGLAAYAVRVRFVAVQTGLIVLEDYEITTRFDSQIVAECFKGLPECKVGQCAYPPSEVLNDRFPLKLRHRDRVEGVFLATGLEPIPKEFLQGMNVPFQLTFWDQFWNEMRTTSQLSVDRSTRQRLRLAGPSRSLFGPDEAPAYEDPRFRPNLNRGRVPADLPGEEVKRSPERPAGPVSTDGEGLESIEKRGNLMQRVGPRVRYRDEE